MMESFKGRNKIYKNFKNARSRKFKKIIKERGRSQI